MSFALQMFIILLLAGLFLVGAEIFVPGGVLGVIGVVAVLGAVIAGFNAFGPAVGTYIAFGIVVLLGAALIVWIKVFPSTPFGRGMTVATNLKTSKGTQSGLAALVGKQGTADSTLRPSGFAVLDGKRVDVVTEGGMIEKGTPVVVVRAEGNHVVVRRTES
jgi:membrane-bound serine protease (ClpP class)